MVSNPRAGDLVVVVFILAATAFLAIGLRWSSGTDGSVAVITKNGEVVRRVDLLSQSTYDTIQLGGQYDLTIEAEPGRIRFSHADCPDQVCVNTGWISMPGRTAACVPAGVLIRIEGSGDDGVDAVAR